MMSLMMSLAIRFARILNFKFARSRFLAFSGHVEFHPTRLFCPIHSALNKFMKSDVYMYFSDIRGDLKLWIHIIIESTLLPNAPSSNFQNARSNIVQHPES